MPDNPLNMIPKMHQNTLQAKLPILLALGCAVATLFFSSLVSNAEGANKEIPPVSPLKVQNAVPNAVELFDLVDVRLQESDFKKAMETDMKYLLKLDPKRFLTFFQRQAGLLKGDLFLGYENKSLGDGPAMAMMGHYLSASSTMYRATGNPQLLERVNMLVDELAKCQAMPGNDGLLTSSAEKKGFAEIETGNLRFEGGRFNKLGIPFYDSSKFYKGLFDAYHLCGNAKAAEIVIKMTDWLDRTLAKMNELQMQQILGREHGGIAEAIADVYTITGEPRHLALAKKLRHDSVFAPAAVGVDALDMMHANTQIPKFRGYERIYELTGNPYWGSSASNFWKFVAQDRTFANGGNSIHESFHPKDKFEDAMHVTPGPETCNTYNMLQLSLALYASTGDIAKLDYYERAMYNQILASQHPAGGFTYYQALLPGGYRTFLNPQTTFACCTGTGMQNHSLYGQCIYGQQGDKLLVNFFIPSELNWRKQGVRITQSTKFPDEPRTQLEIKLAAPKTFTLGVRTPRWIAGIVKMAVNGQAVSSNAKPGSYAEITREWKDGDVLTVELPMAIRTEILPNNKNYTAILYGPMLLGAKLGREGLNDEDFHGPSGMAAKNKLPAAQCPAIAVPLAEVPAHVEQVQGGSLMFKTMGLCKPVDVTLVPVHRIVDERYSFYFPVTTLAGWEEQKKRWTAEEQAERQLESLTVDEIRLGEQQPEVDHNLKSESSRASELRARNIGRLWREASNAGWFSYDMKVDPAKPMQIHCTYWGGDNGNRAWDVLVNDIVVGREDAAPDQPGEFVAKTYNVPAELTMGKAMVTVKIQSRKGSMTGSVFQCRTVLQK